MMGLTIWSDIWTLVTNHSSLRSFMYRISCCLNLCWRLMLELCYDQSKLLWWWRCAIWVVLNLISEDLIKNCVVWTALWCIVWAMVAFKLKIGQTFCFDHHLLFSGLVEKHVMTHARQKGSLQQSHSSADWWDGCRLWPHGGLSARYDSAGQRR